MCARIYIARAFVEESWAGERAHARYLLSDGGAFSAEKKKSLGRHLELTQQQRMFILFVGVAN